MTLPHMRKLFSGFVMAGLAATLVSVGSREAEAAQIQFWLTSDGDGWDCKECCFTGYCCTVPTDECTQLPT